MSRLTDFMETLSDIELAWFYHFRYESFIRLSREKIDIELEKRGMNQELIEQYLQRPLSFPSENACPRCASEKFYNSRETESVAQRFATVEYDVDYRTCLVCLYKEEKTPGSKKPEYMTALGFLRFLINRKK